MISYIIGSFQRQNLKVLLSVPLTGTIGVEKFCCRHQTLLFKTCVSIKVVIVSNNIWH